MARKKRPTFDADQLLSEFRVYDRHVDVVSCYHWMFTTPEDLAATVHHFERYPKIRVGQKDVTPDFTVVFNDGTGLAGEVADIAMHDNSVESVCRQLQKYSELTEMPNARDAAGQTALAQVAPVDVLFLNRASTVPDAARRVFDERLDDPTHWFKPVRRPVLVQVAQDGEDYVFTLWGTGSGTLHRGDRQTVYGDINPSVCHPQQFRTNKVQYGFMADSVPPLYMATRLWTRVLPTSFWGDEVTVPIDDLVSAVQEQHEGHGSTDEVRKGMQVLVAAGLATETESDRVWLVRRQSLRRTEKDVALAIVEKIRRAGVPSGGPPSRRRRQVTQSADQGTLF